MPRTWSGYVNPKPSCRCSEVVSTFCWRIGPKSAQFGGGYFVGHLFGGEVVTYLPHEAVAEVSKDKEPIGRECAEFNWFESQLMSDSSEVRFKWCGLSSDLRFKWFGCQSICASNDFGCLLFWTSSDVVVNWFEIQVIRLSIDLRFKWFGCQSIWDSNELVVNWFEIQMIWMSNGLRFKWFGCQLMCDSNDFVKRSFSARLPSKTKLWRSKTKLFCETSFKIEALKLKNKTFLRDFLQNWSFEAPKRSFSARLPAKMKLAAPKRSISARLPSKMKLWSSKNEAFLRDFLQKWHVDRTLDLRITIRISDFQLHASKVLRLPRKSCAEAYELL